MYPSFVHVHQRRTSNTTDSSVLSLGLGSGEEKTAFMAAAPPTPVSRTTRLVSIAAKKNTLLSNKNPMNKVTIGSQRSGDYTTNITNTCLRIPVVHVYCT